MHTFRHVDATVASLLIALPFSLVAAAISTPIIYFGRKRVRWEVWEIIAFILPCVAWSLLMGSDLSLGKSMANLGEPIFFAPAIPLAALIRVLLARALPERFVSVMLQLILCAIAVATFFLTPPLPE